MANLIANASGNLTGAATFASAEASTGAFSLSRSTSNSTTTTTSDVASPAFSAAAQAVDGVVLFCKRSSASATGTFTVTYSTDGVAATRTVTVNASDLPLNPSLVFFKFSSSFTPSANATTKIFVKSSVAGTVTVYRASATAADWQHAIRRTAAATPAAGDVLLICGEWTAAATVNALTVTMNQTAATDYGTGALSTTTPNGIEIGANGALTFGSAAATNYLLRLSGDLQVWDGGTLNIGTVATPIPRDSTAILEFDQATADSDFGLIANDGSTVVMQGQSRTSGKNVVSCKLSADAAASGGAPSTSTLTVNADTGWLSGDMVAIASTTRTASDCEAGNLNANAGASSIVVKDMTAAVAAQALPLTSNRGLLVAHSGTSPTQAEIILLTRNVKVRSTSATLMAYLNLGPLCTATIAWAEFYYIGGSGNVSGKRGLNVSGSSSGVASAKSITFCSFHDTEGNTFGVDNALGGTLSVNTAFSNNVGWNCATTTGPAFIVANAFSYTDWTFDSNILIRTLNGNGWTLADVGGTFTNNTVVGVSTFGISVSEAATVGTFSGNVAHSCSSNGVSSTAAVNGVISSTTAWRNTGFGVSSTSPGDLLFDGLTLFGNTSANFTLASGDCRINNLVANGDTSFSTSAGLLFNSSSPGRIVVDNSDFGTASGIKTAHSQDISISSSFPSPQQIILRNTKLASATEVLLNSALSVSSYVVSQKHDQTAGNHRFWLRNGTGQTDTTIFNTASPSLRLTPGSGGFGATGTYAASGSPVVNNVNSFTAGNWASLFVGQIVSGFSKAGGGNTTIASFDAAARTITMADNSNSTGTATLTFYGKLESAPQFMGHKVAVASGGTVTPSVKVRKSVVGDGAAYNGNQPRLIVKASPAAGISSDAVLATASGAAGSWETLSGTTAAVTDDAVLEFVVDVDGSSGFVNLDDWA